MRREAALMALLVAELALLAAWQRNGYWSYSDGVYALSARELLHGLAPYRDFAAAQPPPIYLVGALLLLVHDGLASLRAGLAMLDLITAVLVGWSVWRLSRHRPAAWLATLAAPLLPISLAGHAQLVPETLASPLILGGALCCARETRARWGGALLALATLCKLAFALPALAIVLSASRRWHALIAMLVTGCVLVGTSFAVFGSAVWTQVVTAQLQVGAPGLRYAGGLLAQAAWNEVILVCGGAAAVVLALRNRRLAHDPGLLRTVTAAAIAGLALALTVFKRGSYINVLAVAEPPLLVLGACGATWSWRRWRLAPPVVALLGALLAVQSVSILASPSDPWAATRPGARAGLARTAGAAEVDRSVGLARRCPPDRAYSGGPYIAFLAHRRMPGDQPDPFMLRYATADGRFARRAARDSRRCPGG